VKLSLGKVSSLVSTPAAKKFRVCRVFVAAKTKKQNAFFLSGSYPDVTPEKPAFFMPWKSGLSV
jgi:hypothetical protein